MNKKFPISLIVGLICVALTVISTVGALQVSFFDIPVIDMVLSETEKAQTQDTLNQNLAIFENATAEEIKVFEEQTGTDFELLKKMVETPSINRLIKAGSTLEDFGISKDLVGIFDTVRTVILVYGAIIVLFSLLGTLCKKMALTIIALIISLLFYILIAGWLMTALFIIASIAHAVLLSKEKKAAVIAA